MVELTLYQITLYQITITVPLTESSNVFTNDNYLLTSKSYKRDEKFDDVSNTVSAGFSFILKVIEALV